MNPIHNVIENAQRNCNIGENLSWKGFDPMWKASRHMWNESGITKSVMEEFDSTPNEQLKAVNQIVASGFGSFDTIYQWQTAHQLELPRTEKLVLVARRHHVINDLRTIIEKSRDGHKVEVFLQDETFTQDDKD